MKVESESEDECSGDLTEAAACLPLILGYAWCLHRAVMIVEEHAKMFAPSACRIVLMFETRNLLTVRSYSSWQSHHGIFG